MSDKCADAIFDLWVLRSYLLRLCLRCACNVFVLCLVLLFVSYKFLSGCAMMFSIIYFSENIEFGTKQVLSVVSILRLVYIFLVSYLYMLYSHTYMLRHVLAVALVSAP